MYTTSLSSLMHSYDVNKPGLCAALAVPKQWIVSMPNLHTVMLQPENENEFDFFVEQIVLQPGKEWLDLNSDFKINMELIETEKADPNGKIFSYELLCPNPNDLFATRGIQFRSFDETEFVIIAKQRTGAWRLIGSKERGARFYTELRSGTVTKGPSINRSGFAWQVGGTRAYYVSSFVPQDYFDVNGTLGVVPVFSILINESVLVKFSDSDFVFLPSGSRLQRTGAGDYSIRVYHRNQATSLDLSGTINYNTQIQSITNNLPSTLQQLNISTNEFEEIPIGLSRPQLLLGLNAANNKLTEETIEAALEALDLLGRNNGSVDVSGQFPAVSLTPAAAGFKTNLEGKGWTITV